jgi:hypothetical protein
MSACRNNEEPDGEQKIKMEPISGTVSATDSQLKRLRIQDARRTILINRHHMTFESDVLVRRNLKQPVQWTAEYSESFEQVQPVLIFGQRCLLRAG